MCSNVTLRLHCLKDLFHQPARKNPWPPDTTHRRQNLNLDWMNSMPYYLDNRA